MKAALIVWVFSAAMMLLGSWLRLGFRSVRAQSVGARLLQTCPFIMLGALIGAAAAYFFS